MAGTLYLCATPIGNLDDMTLRVLKLLETADIIAAEDTRNTLKLLNHFEIKTPMTSYHEHNKAEKGLKLVERLLAGENIALVTDAGMPGISDPGADLVKLCYEAGVPVTVAPGASAALVALVLSGLDTRRFVFEGFLPMEKKERRAVLSTLEKEHRTMIFYEAPHRLLDFWFRQGNGSHSGTDKEIRGSAPWYFGGNQSSLYRSAAQRGICAGICRLYLAAAAAGSTGKLGKRFHRGTHGALSESKL